MFKLLIVDDEKYTADIIARRIQWSDIGIDGVYVAYCAREAMEILRDNLVDLMICDIEMPGKNGIELLEWVKENHPGVENIFLTGHANFSYAQRAVQLDSFDYLLKPVDYNKLKEVSSTVLEKIRKRRESEEFYATCNRYRDIWENHRPVLIERLWQDILSRRTPLSRESLNRAFQRYGMELTCEDVILPVLIGVDEWEEYLNFQDEEIMKFAVRNIAEEIILPGRPGAIIQDHKGNNLIFLYHAAIHGQAEEVKSLCKRLIEECNKYLKCRLCCYIGRQTSPLNLTSAYKELMDMEAANTGQSNLVFYNECKQQTGPVSFTLPSSTDWAALMEAGKKEEVLARLAFELKELGKNGMVPEIVEAYGFAIVHAVYQVLHKKGFSLYRIFSQKDISEGISYFRSGMQFRNWIHHFVSAVMDYMRENNKSSSAIIDKVRAYIHQHLFEDFAREDLAAHVYLNEDYLSRLFKKEVGESITGYVVRERMKKAKELLTHTNDKISDISTMLGYCQFSYFTRIFKQTVGLSPQEYRKKFQK